MKTVRWFTLSITIFLVGGSFAAAAENKEKSEAVAPAESAAESAPQAAAKEATDVNPETPAAPAAKAAMPAKEEPAAPAAKPAEAAKKKGAAAPAVAEAPGANYFGIKAEGKRFVFVVDNSASMVKGRFDTACYEIINTVSGMTDDQEFYVILFSDTAYPLFYPKPVKGYVRATRQNKDLLYAWLKGVPCVWGTYAQEATARALAAKPDAIFLLGDGGFLDGTTKYLLEQPKGDTKLFTVSMAEGKGAGVAERDLKQIAEHFGGTFTRVGVNPQFATVERPYLRVRTGDWGIAIKKKK